MKTLILLLLLALSACNGLPACADDPALLLLAPLPPFTPVCTIGD